MAALDEVIGYKQLGKVANANEWMKLWSIQYEII